MAGEPALHEDFQRVHPALLGDLVRLRPRESEDLPRINEMFNDPDVLAGLTIAFPQSMAGIRDWFEQTRTRDDQVTFVIETPAGESIGICSLEAIDARSRTSTLGIWIGKAYWDTGYGTDALRLLCRFGFQQMNLQRIQLWVYEENRRARRVYERVGFRHEGVARRGQFVGGRNVDVLLMGLLNDEFDEF